MIMTGESSTTLYNYRKDYYRLINRNSEWNKHRVQVGTYSVGIFEGVALALAVFYVVM